MGHVGRYIRKPTRLSNGGTDRAFVTARSSMNGARNRCARAVIGQRHSRAARLTFNNAIFVNHYGAGTVRVARVVDRRDEPDRTEHLLVHPLLEREIPLWRSAEEFEGAPRTS
jgi:hypothetical protein